MTTTDDYYDIEAAERDKFLQIDGVGPVTADRLVKHYHFFHRAVERILGHPNGWYRPIGREKTDEIRDALQEAGYEPPCECGHYEEIDPEYPDDEDVYSRCRECGGVLLE